MGCDDYGDYYQEDLATRRKTERLNSIKKYGVPSKEAEELAKLITRGNSYNNSEEDRIELAVALDKFVTKKKYKNTSSPYDLSKRK